METAVLQENQYYIVSGLKRYRKIVKQEMLKNRPLNNYSNSKYPSKYINARQKSKIYETLLAMVIHEGVDETIQFALELYAKLPHTPIKSVETIKACEQALESFFLLTSVSPYQQQFYYQQRPATVTSSNEIRPQDTAVPQELAPTYSQNHTEVYINN